MKSRDDDENDLMEELIEEIQDVLHENNWFIKQYKTAKDKLEESEDPVSYTLSFERENAKT